MGQPEPSLSRLHSESPLFFIGIDSRGNWVVQDRHGLRGGLFVNHARALKYALFENGNRPQAVVLVPGVFELDLSPRPAPAAPRAPDNASTVTPLRIVPRSPRPALALVGK